LRKKKSDAFKVFVLFQKLVENLLNSKITYFESDGGKEYDNGPFIDHLLTYGIYFRKSAPYTQQQNGVVECKHRHIVEMARTMLIDAIMPDAYWHDAILTMAYVINRLPTSVLNGFSPYLELFSKPLDYSFMRVFWCQRFPNLTPYTKNKLQPHFIQ